MGAITTTPTDRASIPARLSILCSRCIGCPRKQEAFLASLSSMPTCPLCPVPQTQYLATALNYLAVSPTSWIGSAALSHDLHLPQRDLGPKKGFGGNHQRRGRHRHATFRSPRSPILPWYVAQMSFVAACLRRVPSFSRCGRAFHVCSGDRACLPILHGFACRNIGGRRLLSPIPSDAGWARVVGHDFRPGARYRCRCWTPAVRELNCLPRGWVAPQNRCEDSARHVDVQKIWGTVGGVLYLDSRGRSTSVRIPADGRPLGEGLVLCLCHSTMFLGGIGP